MFITNLSHNADLVTFIKICSKCLPFPGRKVLRNILVPLTVMDVNIISLTMNCFLSNWNTDNSVRRVSDFRWTRSAPTRPRAQIACGNGDCVLAGVLGSSQTYGLGSWAARRYGAVMRAKPSGHDELKNTRNKYTITLTGWTLITPIVSSRGKRVYWLWVELGHCWRWIRLNQIWFVFYR